MNPDICNLDSEDNGCPSIGDVQAVCCTTGQSDHPAVTNSTACIDGDVHGWKTWCTKDDYNNSKYCSDLVFGGNTKDGSDFDGTLFDEVMSNLNQSAHLRVLRIMSIVGGTFALKMDTRTPKLVMNLSLPRTNFQEAS